MGQANHWLDELDDSQVRSHHIRLFLLAAAGLFVDGYDLNIIGAALLSLVPALHPSAIELGWLSTAALLGTAVGAVLLGRLTDRIGRKAMFVLDLIFFVVFAVATGIASNMLWVIIFRFLLGIGIGADYPIAASYVAEFAPKHRRGAFLAATVGMWGVGTVMSTLVAIVVLSLDHSGNAWRYILASGAVPAAIVIVLRSRMPESPRWLMLKRRTQDAATAMKQLGFAPEAVAREAKSEPIRVPVYSYRKLFSPELIRATVFVTMSWLLFDVLAYGIGIFQPILLEGLGFGKGIPALVGSLEIGMFGFVGVIGSIFCVEALGRKPQQIIGFIGMAVGLFLLGIVSSQGAARLPVLGLLAAFGIYNLSAYWGPLAVTYVSPAEVYPTSLRAGGHGLASMSAKVGAVIGAFSLPILNAALGVSHLMYILTFVALAGALVTLIFGVETKGAKSLEEIEQELLGQPPAAAPIELEA